METTFAIVLPVFGLVACGSIIGRTRLMTGEGVRGLGNFVFYLAIPALLFRTVATTEVPPAVDLGIVFAYFGGCLLVFMIGMVIGRAVFALRLEEQAILAMGGVFGNTVLLGIPLIFAVFGDAGVLPMMLIVTFHSLTLFPLATLVVQIGRGERSGWQRVLVSTAGALARNPVILAMLAGVAWNLAGFALPTPIDSFAKLLAGAAAPCALFALGATLAGYRIGGNLAESLTMVGIKLVVHPLVVWLLATAVFAIDPTWAAVATVTAALPTGANVFILAQQYDVYLARATSAVVIATALAVVTVAALVAVLAPGAARV